MATQDRHPSQSETAAPAPQADAAQPAASATLSSKGTSRRRFAKAGAGATGVLLTLYSQPGMACTYCGISPSAAVSAIGQNKTIGTLSHRGPAAVCNGIRPIDWTRTAWPAGCLPTDAFSKHFGCKPGSAYASASCKDIILGAACDSTRMAQYMLAAYLNILSHRVNFLSIDALRDVWSEWVATGYYAPMAGQKWYANDIVGYLYGTMD